MTLRFDPLLEPLPHYLRRFASSLLDHGASAALF